MARKTEADVCLDAEARNVYRPTTRNDLEELGKRLDERPQGLNGNNVAMELAIENLRVRTRAGGIAALAPNGVQRTLEESSGGQKIILKARQMGLTTWVAARFFLRTITRPGTLTVQVAHTREAAEEIFRIVHRFYQHLSDALRTGPLKTSRANVRQLVFPDIDSQYRVESAGDRNAGRGLTAQNLHCSELAWWPGHPAETLAGLRAALAPDAELVLESTPKGVGGCFHAEWVAADEKGMIRYFFPWWLESAYREPAVDAATLTDEERALMEREGLSLEQIAFRRKIRANYRGLARQEYAEDAESCFLSSGDSVFEMEAVEKRLREAPEPFQRRRNGTMEVWLSPVAGRRYLVSVDPAGGGTEGDFAAFEVIDIESGLQCAEYAGHSTCLEQAQLSAEVAREYNDAWLVVERNNHGSGVLAYLGGVCHYERVFEQDGKPGWLTSSYSKPLAIGKLEAALVARPELFQSRALLGECRSFVRLSNGGMGAKPGTHDDRVMAMAIALAARAEILARNL